MSKDVSILRGLAELYSIYALDGRSEQRKNHYRIHNSLNLTRPPVLVFEVPWGEIKSDELVLRCEDPQWQSYETYLRRCIYQFRHFEGDFAVHDYFRSPVVLNDTGNGLKIEENTISSVTDTDIMSHGYKDILPDEDAVREKVKMPVVTLNKKATEENLNKADEIFHGIMPVRKNGVTLYLASWDQIPRFHGVENCLMDLYDRPEFAHLLIDTFTNINLSYMNQYEKLNVLDTDPMYLHCTPAVTNDLPVLDMDTDTITLKDVWCRAMAQLFAVVSPDMHEEFDLQYTKKLFDKCGLSYYGCCEPLHNKIDNLRQFKNLRRISVTAWADVDIAAEKIGKDYILSYKSNPAFAALPVFDPAPVVAETRKVLEACRRNDTPCEFILKDISTISENPQNLSNWVKTVNSVIDEYYA